MFVPLLALLASIISLCVGSSYAKQLFAHIGPEGTTVLRVGFAALMLIAIWRPWRLPITAGDGKWILLYGLTLGAMNLLFYMGIKTIPIGVAIAIEFIGPLALAIFSSRRVIDFVWIGFAALGMVLLSPFVSGVGSGGSGGGGGASAIGGGATAAAANLDPVGVTYILIAAVLWALYIVFGKRAGRGHAGQVTSLGLGIGSLVVLPFGFVQAQKAIFEPSYLLIGLMVALLSSAIPYTLEMYALKRMPQQTFGILLSMEPAVGAVTGFFILNEVLTPFQWLAIGCIIIASIGCTITLKKPEETPLVDADGIAPRPGDDEASGSHA